jgi:hypothetical protein
LISSTEAVSNQTTTTEQSAAAPFLAQLEKQPALFELDDDMALLLPAEERRKRYTAQHCAGMEKVYELIVMLLGRGVSVEDISRGAHVNTRTVRAIAARSGEKVAGYNKHFGAALLSLSGRWFAKAMTKEDEAGPKDLTVMAGIAAQNGMALSAIGEVDGERETKEELDRVAAAAALRRLALTAGAEPVRDAELAPPLETQSVGPERNTNNLGAPRADVGTYVGTSSPADSRGVAPDVAAEEGRGGSDAKLGGAGALPHRERGSYPKTPSDFVEPSPKNA